MNYYHIMLLYRHAYFMLILYNTSPVTQKNLLNQNDFMAYTKLGFLLFGVDDVFIDRKALKSCFFF